MCIDWIGLMSFQPTVKILSLISIVSSWVVEEIGVSEENHRPLVRELTNFLTQESARVGLELRQWEVM